MAEVVQRASVEGEQAGHGVECVPGRSSLRRWSTRIALVAGCLYVAGFVLLLALEDRMLFTGATFARPWREPPDHLSIRDLNLTDSEGNRIHGWFTALAGWTPRDGAVLLSHGQGGNLSYLSGRAACCQQFLGRAVLLYDYPGYGRSSGRPSEAGCYAAGEAAFRWLVDEQKIPVGEIILLGESLGGAVATELATRHDARLLLLQGAFTSFPDMAQKRFPVYPGRYVVHNRMDNEEKIRHVRCPVFITHGTADGVVPFSHGQRLYAAASGPKRFLCLEGGGHSPPSGEGFFSQVREFLAEVAPGKKLSSGNRPRSGPS